MICAPGRPTGWGPEYNKIPITPMAPAPVLPPVPLKFYLIRNIAFRFFPFCRVPYLWMSGNIWLSGGLENAQTDIVWKDLPNQLAVGTGLGMRLDFDFFVIRFDLGIKVRDPALISEGDEWVILTRNVPKNFTYNIAFGYPF